MACKSKALEKFKESGVKWKRNLVKIVKHSDQIKVESIYPITSEHTY